MHARGLLVTAMVMLSTICGQGARAEDVFYAAGNQKRVKPRPASENLIAPQDFEPVEAKQPEDGVIIRHDLQKNERHEFLRIKGRIIAVNTASKGDRVVYVAGLERKRDGEREYDYVVRAVDLDQKLIGELKHEEFTKKYRGSMSGLPALSPDDSTFLFAARAEPKGEGKVVPKASTYPKDDSNLVSRIFTYNIKSREFTDLGEGVMPSWSPDGKQILFSELVVEPSKYTVPRLAIMGADGSGRKTIGDFRTCCGVFRPDGEKIAFIKILSEESQIWTCEPDGTKPQRVTAPTSLYASPRWLTDGKRLTVMAIAEDMQKAVDETLVRVKGKPPGKPMPAAKLSDNREELLPHDLYVLVTENANVRRLTPGGVAKGTFAVDSKAAEWVRLLVRDRTEFELPVYSPPEGWKMTFRGTSALLQSKTGASKPLPDGLYKMGPNHFIEVVSGQNTVRSGDRLRDFK